MAEHKDDTKDNDDGEYGTPRKDEANCTSPRSNKTGEEYWEAGRQKNENRDKKQDDDEAEIVRVWN